MEKYSEMDFQDKLEALEELLGVERMYESFISMLGVSQIDDFLDQIIIDFDLINSLFISEDGEDIIEGMRQENEEFYYSLGSYQALGEYLEDYDYLAIPPDIEEYWERLEAKAIHNDWKRG